MLLKKNAARIFYKSLSDKDREFLIKDLREAIDSPIVMAQLKVMKVTGKDLNAARKALESKNPNDLRAYRLYNRILSFFINDDSEIISKFDNALRAEGYGGIADINDRLYSGYNVKNATIFLNGKDVDVSKVEKIGKLKTAGNFALAYPRMVFEAELKDPAVYAIAGGVGAVKYSRRKKEAKFVQDYRRRHPDTNLSYRDIVKMYRRMPPYQQPTYTKMKKRSST